MSEVISRFLLRLPVGLKEDLADEARARDISLNSLIVERLSSLPDISVAPRAKPKEARFSDPVTIHTEVPKIEGLVPASEIECAHKNARKLQTGRWYCDTCKSFV